MELTAPADLAIPTLGLTVKKGDVIEVAGDDAKSLEAQGWTRVDKPKNPKGSEPTSKES